MKGRTEAEGDHCGGLGYTMLRYHSSLSLSLSLSLTTLVCRRRRRHRRRHTFRPVRTKGFRLKRCGLDIRHRRQPPDTSPQIWGDQQIPTWLRTIAALPPTTLLQRLSHSASSSSSSSLISSPSFIVSSYTTLIHLPPASSAPPSPPASTERRPKHSFPLGGEIRVRHLLSQIDQPTC